MNEKQNSAYHCQKKNNKHEENINNKNVFLALPHCILFKYVLPCVCMCVIIFSILYTIFNSIVFALGARIKVIERIDNVNFICLFCFVSFCLVLFRFWFCFVMHIYSCLDFDSRTLFFYSIHINLSIFTNKLVFLYWSRKVAVTQIIDDALLFIANFFVCLSFY